MTATQAPSPSDIIWQNTYKSRFQRLFYSWGISILVSILTIVWLIPVTGLAGLLNLKTIRWAWPGLANVLEKNTILSSLVQSTLPTAALSLMSVLTPFLYDCNVTLPGVWKVETNLL
jgi:calcium permeable stress-gated cation channel